MGRKLESLEEVRICWGVINLLEEEDCFHYHLLLHLGDGDALAVWRRRIARKEGACARNPLLTIYTKCSMHLHCSTRSFQYTRTLILTAFSVVMGRGENDNETGITADNDNHVPLYFFFSSS
jgi:hypothetical protein